MKRWIYTAAILLIAGCGPETRTYTLNVQNNSVEPMTVVLTKDGPPMENYWLPPEDLGMMRHAPPEMAINGVTVPPGGHGDQTREGKFDSGTQAVARIYRGKKDNLYDLMGIGPDSPNRTDIRLRPGVNQIVVDAQGRATLK